jgi:DnaJ-class molecular chaperone
MGLLNSFNDWRQARYENHLSQMKELNKCPDCYGRGYFVYPAIEYTYLELSPECTGCNGSGRYNDWESIKS